MLSGIGVSVRNAGEICHYNKLRLRSDE